MSHEEAPAPAAAPVRSDGPPAARAPAGRVARPARPLGRERFRTPVGPAGPPGRPAARPGGYDRFRYQGRTTVSKRWRAEPMAMCMSRYW